MATTYAPAPTPTIGGTDKYGNAVNVPFGGTQIPSMLPPKNPAPVISSNLATNKVNDIQNVVTSAQTQMQTAAQVKADADAAEKARIAAIKPVVNTTVKPTADEIIANQGMQTIYDRATGEPKQITDTEAIPSTHTKVDIKNPIAQDTVSSADSQFVVKKLADGTYGKYDQAGNFLGMTDEAQFTRLKVGSAAEKAYQDALINGPLLNDNQKSIIKGITDTYKRLLETQATMNANATGTTAVMQNLYGFAGTDMSNKAIQGEAEKGAAKIADINSRMTSDVAKMTESLKADNLLQLKDAYKSYIDNSASLQKEIDDQKTRAQAMADKAQQQKETRDNAILNDIDTLIDKGTQGAATPAQLAAARKARDNMDVVGVAEALGDSLLSETGWAGQYLSYAKEMRDKHPGAPVMSRTEYFDWQDTNKLQEAARIKAEIAANTEAQGNAPFQGTIDNMLSGISAKAPYERESTRLESLANKGDWSNLLQALKVRAKSDSSLIPADKRSELIGAETGIPAMKRFASALKAYENTPGAQPGFFQGNVESIDRRLGQLKNDPKFSALATELEASFQQYRKDMTGAAFSAAESAQYEKVVPSMSKTLDLNLAVIQGMQNFLTHKVDGIYGSAIGEGYDNLKGLVEKEAPKSPADEQKQASDSIQSWVKTATPENKTNLIKYRTVYDEAKKKAGETPTDADFIKQFGNDLGISFNEVDGDTNLAMTVDGGEIQQLLKQEELLKPILAPSEYNYKPFDAVIPKSARIAYVHNNPGNLKFMGQVGATKGEPAKDGGYFAKFSSAKDGVLALQKQIQMDINRGHTLESFITKYAPPKSNDTEAYIAKAMKTFGVDRSTKISKVSRDELLKFLANYESSTKIL